MLSKLNSLQRLYQSITDNFFAIFKLIEKAVFPPFLLPVYFVTAWLLSKKYFDLPKLFYVAAPLLLIDSLSMEIIMTEKRQEGRQEEFNRGSQANEKANQQSQKTNKPSSQSGGNRS